ncbi:MAG: glycosyltransferase [Deltaproteobacteria bacterium]|nr:glycosyltransferase [Deltaproteobacteria bacterium]
MGTLISYIIIGVYFLAAFLLMAYGLNCYLMVFLFQKGRKGAEIKRSCILRRYSHMNGTEQWPKVTTQIPIYNEYNVAARVMRSVARMKYPKDRHEIQVLDDSTDKTRDLIDQVAHKLRNEGHDLHVIRRNTRRGFKAGALAEGLKSARGELITIFDADFAPSNDYLQRIVPFFLENDRLGLVQARWGHLNRKRSLLTRVQSIGIDGHFMIEQSARNWTGLFMNFNGTAGMWRKNAIEESGGWQWDTLTEDMDLSYRVQFHGWHTLFVPDVVVPAEIPEDVGAFKNQQFRWAKGSIQTALKLLPGIFVSNASIFKKVEAFFHLTHYLVHPMMVIMAILALPVLMMLEFSPSPAVYTGIAILLGMAMAAPSTLYMASQRASYEKGWGRSLVYLPFLVAVGIGIALSNSRAVLEALAGHQSPFVRTPKKGDKEMMHYRVRLPWSGLLEILFGVYCAGSLGYYLAAGKYLVGPFLAAYASGFLFVGFLTLAHASGLSK